MAINLVFDETSLISSKMLEISTEAQQVTSQNIANADTPGYTRLKMDFRRRLADAVNSGDLNRIQTFQAKVENDVSNPVSSDGNNVILPQEMNDMMQNSVFNNLINRAFKTRMSILKSAINR